MKLNRWILIVAAAFVAIALAAGAALNVRAVAGQRASPGTEALEASGFIEAEEIAVAPELGGRVIELLAEEGDEVAAEQVLARLDGRLLEARIEAANAVLDMARAGLAKAQAGARPAQIRQAEAELARAVAARDGADQAWQDALAIRGNPQQLGAQIVLAEAQLNTAKAALSEATALKDAAEIADTAFRKGMESLEKAKEKLKDIPEPARPSLPGVPLEAHLIPNAYWKSWVGVNAAQVGLEGAQVALGDLYALKSSPQELESQVNAAEAQYWEAEAGVEMARALLEVVQAGASREEVAIAQAQVEQAQAALATLVVLRDKLVVTAPVGGLVLEHSLHTGELAAPGAALLKLADLDELTLTVYVPAGQIGRVFIGQSVQISVDSFPGRVFAGTVIAVADEAEFTPRTIQTREERAEMVFGVEMQIPNPDHALKPGLPADAVIVIQE